MKDELIVRSVVILIGPMSAGKSTIAPLLAEAFDLERVEMDTLRWAYYEEIGYDRALESRIAQQEGWSGLFRYWKPFEAHAVERAVAEHRNCVLDFGAGHSVYEDAELLQRVQRALAPFPYVVLLLPAPDLDFSARIVNARFSQEIEATGQEVNPELLEMNELFCRHPSNRQLATKVVYTLDHTPEQTCEEIVRWIEDEGGVVKDPGCPPPPA
jgi:shikimate kinase